MAISDWPEEQRPRERLIRQGAKSLTDAELLAVFLRVGVSGKSAVDLAHEVLAHFGSLSRLFAARLSDFSLISGMGPAKFAQLQAVLELAKRALHEELKAGAVLSSSTAVRRYLQLLFNGRTYECFVVLYLDVRNRLISAEELFRGTLTQASVYPREVVKSSLLHNAASVMIAHNHPAGTAVPSEADNRITQALKTALALVDIRLLDHFIVAGNGIYSFAEHGGI